MSTLDAVLTQLRQGDDPRAIVERVPPYQRAALREGVAFVLAEAVMVADLEVLARRLAELVIVLHRGIEARSEPSVPPPWRRRG